VKDFCIILVFNAKYIRKVFRTICQIRDIGLYKGDIVCVINNELKNLTSLIYKDDNVIIKHFADVDRREMIKILNASLICERRGIDKTLILYHKLYCFHTWFRENYKKCLYIDVKMQIFKPLHKIINLNCDNKLLAHSDVYPFYKRKLSCQFENVKFKKLFDELNNKYDLNIDYFQSTMMLYDTKIINDDTFDELVRLSLLYINSINSDQGVLNIYFNCMFHKWEQIQIKDDDTYYYDFHEREPLKKTDYIMLKYPMLKYKYA